MYFVLAAAKNFDGRVGHSCIQSDADAYGGIAAVGLLTLG